MMHQFKYILLLFLFASLLSSCAKLPDNSQMQHSSVLQNTDNTTIGKSVAEFLSPFPNKSGFHLLNNGLDAFVGRSVMIQEAEKSIDVQYYIYKPDLTGKLLAYRLIKAADRGVRVRILLDDLGNSVPDQILNAWQTHPNIDIRLFNPYIRNLMPSLQNITRFGSVTRRMHNKALIVDNQMCVVGGRNIGNEYFDADPDLVFVDLDAIAVGPVVNSISTSFDLYWNSPLSYPIDLMTSRSDSTDYLNAYQDIDDFADAHDGSVYMKALRNSPLAEQLRNDSVEFLLGDALAVYDAPEKITTNISKKKYHLAPQLEPYFTNIASELIIISAYFVPGKEGVAFFSDLRKKGIRVKIVTNSFSSTDVAIVNAGYTKYRKALLRAGVELYELDKKITKDERKKLKKELKNVKTSLHTKTFVIDKQMFFIGTLNLDPRSINENTEIGILFKTPLIAEAISEWYDENVPQLAFKLKLNTDPNGSEKITWHIHKDGKEVVFDKDPYSGFWKRFWVDFLSIFPIESQL